MLKLIYKFKIYYTLRINGLIKESVVGTYRTDYSLGWLAYGPRPGN